MGGTGPTRAGWAMTVFGALSCGGPLPAEQLESVVRGYFDARGIEPESIACPSPLAREAGLDVACLATIDGHELMVQAVAATDGGLSIRPEHGTLVTARLEPEIVQTLRGQGYDVTEIHCEGQVWIVAPGAEHRCELTVQGGRLYAWHGTFFGDGSRHRARLEPLEGAPP